jgi:hypothetical protein
MSGKRRICLVDNPTRSSSMNHGKLVFAQLIEVVPIKKFRQCVKRYGGDHRVRNFTCWDQFLCMVFAQLTYRESLRDIEVCLRTKGKKLYHLGIRGTVARTTLARANDRRDWRIYQDFAMVLIEQARALYLNDTFSVRLKRAAYALDSTTIDLKSIAFPVGEVSFYEGSRQASYPTRSSRQHPLDTRDFKGKYARCEHP